MLSTFTSTTLSPFSIPCLTVKLDWLRDGKTCRRCRRGCPICLLGCANFLSVNAKMRSNTVLTLQCLQLHSANSTMIIAQCLKNRAYSTVRIAECLSNLVFSFQDNFCSLAWIVKCRESRVFVLSLKSKICVCAIFLITLFHLRIDYFCPILT